MLIFKSIAFIFALLWAMPLLAQDSSVANDDVPYGVASSWLYGHHMLADGNVEEALRNLHYAYRTHPDVPLVAWDFQQALVAGHFYKDALEVLGKLVDDYPDSAEYRLQRSQVYLQVGKNKKALADLRELRRRNQTSLDVIVGEATILAAMGKSDEALDTCRDALAETPDQGPRIYLTMSVILDQEQRHDELPALMEEAVAAYPDSPQLRDILIRSLMTVGRADDALETARQSDRHFAELLQVPPPEDLDNPENSDLILPPRVEPPSFVVELADIYSQMGAPEKAIEILEPKFEDRSLALDPSLWLARLQLGTGHVDEGMLLVEEILKRWPGTGEAWFIRGRALEGKGLLDEALVDFAKGVKFAPHDPQVSLGYLRGMLVAWERDLQVRSKSSAQLAQVEQLRVQASLAEGLVPASDAEGQLVLGYAFRSTDQLEKAVIAFEKAALQPELIVPATLQMSVCYDDLEQPQKARFVLEDLYKKFPDDAEVANSLGYYLAEKGEDLDKAQRLVAQALEDGPGIGAYLDSMGWVLYQQGKTDEAFDYMIQAVNVLPDDPVILEHLGLVLLKMGQADEAEEMLRRALILGGDKERLGGYLDSLLQSGDDE